MFPLPAAYGLGVNSNRKGLQVTTEERLDQLERELSRAKRRQRWLLAVVGLAIVGAILAWTLTKTTPAAHTQAVGGTERVVHANTKDIFDEVSSQPQVVRATAFVLVDDEGRKRGKLEMASIGPTLGLCDESGKTRAELVVSADGPALCLYDEKGKSPYSVMLFPGGLFLRDENGKLRAGLSVLGDGVSLELNDANGEAPTVEHTLDVIRAGAVPFWDERGKRGIWLGVVGEGTSLQMNDANGKPRAGLTVLKDGPAIRLYDENGKPRAALAVVKDGSMLILVDEKGKPIWTAP